MFKNPNNQIWLQLKFSYKITGFQKSYSKPRNFANSQMYQVNFNLTNKRGKQNKKQKLRRYLNHPSNPSLNKKMLELYNKILNQSFSSSLFFDFTVHSRSFQIQQLGALWSEIHYLKFKGLRIKIWQINNPKRMIFQNLLNSQEEAFISTQKSQNIFDISLIIRIQLLYKRTLIYLRNFQIIL
ncbi:hypothetical protein ABPG72_006294 [Tetrahymena utriculariae]